MMVQPIPVSEISFFRPLNEVTLAHEFFRTLNL